MDIQLTEDFDIIYNVGVVGNATGKGKKMEVKYVSTRNKAEQVTASQAVLRGLATDGGLYVPTTIPKFDKTLEELSDMTYQEVAYEVMKLLLTDYTEEELKNCINRAYDEKFDTQVQAVGLEGLEVRHGRDCTTDLCRRRILFGTVPW